MPFFYFRQGLYNEILKMVAKVQQFIVIVYKFLFQISLLIKIHRNEVSCSFLIEFKMIIQILFCLPLSNYGSLFVLKIPDQSLT